MADRISVNGARGPFLTSQTTEENTRTGTQTHYTWEGTYQECLNKRQRYRNEGASEIALRPLGNGNWQVTASYPYDEYGREPVFRPSTHELEIDTAQPSVYSSQILRNKMGGGTPTDLGDKIIALVARICQEADDVDLTKIYDTVSPKVKKAGGNHVLGSGAAQKTEHETNKRIR